MNDRTEENKDEWDKQYWEKFRIMYLDGSKTTDAISATSSAGIEVQEPLTTDNPRRALQFHYRHHAEDAAVSIGWRRNDAIEIDVMGFRLWAISNPHQKYLTKWGFEKLYEDRRAMLAWPPKAQP